MVFFFDPFPRATEDYLHDGTLIRRIDWFFGYFRSDNDNWFGGDWIHFGYGLAFDYEKKV